MARNEANDIMIVATPNRLRLAEKSCCTESSSVETVAIIIIVVERSEALSSKLEIVD
jgi:hypothetical protein